jgi:hypothetical protein
MCDCLRWAVTFLGYFNQRLSNALMMTKNRLGYRLGEFFTNSSGRPVYHPFLLPPTNLG